MMYTKKNLLIAEYILKLLAERKCTVEESSEILSFVGMTIRNSTTVQANEKAKNLLTYVSKD